MHRYIATNSVNVGLLRLITIIPMSDKILSMQDVSPENNMVLNICIYYISPLVLVYRQVRVVA